MKFMLALLAFGYVALASPSLPIHPGGIGGLFRGPNSETIIKGPDGSIITAAAEGGEVQSNIEPIVVAEPTIQKIPPPVLDTIAVSAPAVEKQQSSDLIGPSGRIATQGQSAVIAGPASTTVSGPGILAQSVVKGPPIVATPDLNLLPPVLSPLAAVTNRPSIASISVTPASLGTLTAELSPVSVTASPLSVTSLSPLSIIDNTDFGQVSVGGVVSPSVATVTAAPPVLSVTGSSGLSATAASYQAVASASSSPHFTAASVSSANGAAASALATPNQATAVVQSADEISAVSPLSINPSTAGLNPLPIIPSSGISTLGLGFSGIDGRLDLSGQLIPDQIAIDNRQIHLNPALIPTGNIIPPEIPVTPRIPIGRLGPTPGTLLTTPGLGTYSTSTNIIREETDGSLNVTPSTVQKNPQVSLTPQQSIALQNQQALLNNQIQSTHSTVPVVRNEEGLSMTPNTLQINSQVNLDSLSADQIIALQNQQNVLNNQIQQAQQAAAAGIRPPGADPRGQGLFTPNPTLATGKTISTLGNIPQNILAAELAKSGIDPSQIHLTNIPLSAVSGLSQSGLNGIVNDGLLGEEWGRYGRNTDNGKKSEKKVKEKTNQ